MLALALTLLLGSSVGPEVRLAPAGGPATPFSLQYRTSIASNGTDYLLAWIDKRREVSTHSVVATRITGDGRVLDVNGIIVAAQQSDDPSLAPTATGWVIAYDERGAIVFRLLRADGTFEAGSAGAGRQIGAGDCPSVASANGVFLVAWSNFQDIYAQRFAFDGSAVDAAPFTVQASMPSGACPVVAASRTTPTEWLVAWSGGGQVHGAILPTTGPGSGSGMPLAASLLYAYELTDVAPHEDGWYVAWKRVDDAGYLMEGRRVSTAQPFSTEHVLFDGASSVYHAALAAGPDGVVRAYGTATFGFHTRFVPADGGLPLAGPSGSTNPSFDSRLAATGSTLLRAYGFGNDLAHEVLDLAFNPLDGGVFTTNGGGHHQLAVERGGPGSLVLWTELDTIRVRGTRVDGDGQVLDAPPLELTPPGTRSAEAALAWGFGRWAVGWHDGSFAHARFVYPDGSMGQPLPLNGAAAGEVEPSVAVSPTGFYVAYIDYLANAVAVLTLELDGGQSAPQLIAPGRGNKQHPRIVSGGSEHLVVWQEDNRAWAEWLAPGGKPHDAGFVLSTGVDVEASPQAAFDGTGWLVAWTNYWEPLVARVAGRSATAPEQLASAGPWGHAVRYHLASAPGAALLSWCDTDTGDVFMRPVSRYGASLDAGARIVVSNGPLFECEPAFSGLGNGLFVYNAFEPGPNTMTARARLWIADRPGATCTQGWQCETGLCSSGRCSASGAGGGAGGGSGGSAGSGGAAGMAGGGSGTGGSTGAGGGATPRELRLACGCGAGEAWLMAWLLLATIRRAARAPGRRTSPRR